LQSTHVGPISSANWLISLGNTDSTIILNAGVYNSSSAPWRIQDTFPPLSQVNIYPDRYSTLPAGATVRLDATLRSGSSTVETTNQTQTLVPVDGGLKYLAVPNNSAITDIQTKVTSLQSAVADVTSFVTKTFGTGVVRPIVDLLLHPPPGFTSRELIGDYSGSHRFTRPGGGFGVNAFGISWEVLSYGGGIGLDTGVPVRFETRLLDLAVNYLDNSAHEYVANALEFNWSNQYVFFETSFPSSVDVVIAPSVTLRFYWLLFHV
jgi:hypothetical protein